MDAPDPELLEFSPSQSSGAELFAPPCWAPTEPSDEGCVVLPTLLSSIQFSSLIERISDAKDLKKLLRTRNNVLVLYSKSVVSMVAAHGPEGASCAQSIVAFLKDPKGPPLWEEDPGAKDVVHIDSEKDFRRLLKKEEKPILIIFYSPWCSLCKRTMPHFQKAATQLRGQFVLAGMNLHSSEFENIKEEYGIRSYPTISYFEKGRYLFQYNSYGSTADDIVEWLKKMSAERSWGSEGMVEVGRADHWPLCSCPPPQPQVPETPWADEGGSVYHLTDEDFGQFVKEHSSVLVMFHAPWCGHCKKMKPEFENAAEVLHGEADSSGVLAAVDATVNRALAERFHISEFPTLKYFKNGEIHAVPTLRTKKSLIEWMRNPEAPPAPEPTWEEQQTNVLHLAGHNFRETLKRKKHTLVMFYAPWCPHCKKVIPHFTATADVFKDDRKIVCAAVDCVQEKNRDLCQQEAVKAYPTFHYYHYGKFAEKYDSDRTGLSIVKQTLHYGQLPPPAPQPPLCVQRTERRELGFTSFIRTLREGDHERLGKKKEEL
ncbi:protein disulfide-isomerase A5 precursor [Camelus ferus]|nr:protein disulfide-isomerase A5 precursor [Camelus ferus]